MSKGTVATYSETRRESKYEVQDKEVLTMGWRKKRVRSVVIVVQSGRQDVVIGGIVRIAGRLFAGDVAR